MCSMYRFFSCLITAFVYSLKDYKIVILLILHFLYQVVTNKQKPSPPQNLAYELFQNVQHLIGIVFYFLFLFLNLVISFVNIPPVRKKSQTITIASFLPRGYIQLKTQTKRGIWAIVFVCGEKRNSEKKSKPRIPRKSLFASTATFVLGWF